MSDEVLTIKEVAAKSGNGSAAVVGFEQTLWQAADKLRNNKYISDAFEEKHAALEAEKKSGADPEDPDEYRADNIFWVPKEARWPHLQGLGIAGSTMPILNKGDFSALPVLSPTKEIVEATA